MEVRCLIAAGLSNAEIAQKLYLSAAKVKVHTRSVFGKLGVNSRTQALAQAQKRKLLEWASPIASEYHRLKPQISIWMYYTTTLCLIS